MKKIYLFFISGIFCQQNFAQQGSIDLTFNPGAGAGATVYSTQVYPDGRIVLAGDFTTYSGATRTRVAMATANGSNIATFNPGTGADNTVHAVAIQPSDGKIIISGMFNNYNSTARRGIARIDSNGTLDPAFVVGTGFNGGAYGHNDIVIQPDGKIVVGGLFTSYNGSSAKYIARLNTNGTLDATFNTGTGANAQLYAVARQGNGSFIIGGSFTTFNGATHNYIARLDSTGAIDPTFTAGTGADAMIFEIEILPSGKIMIGGAFTYYDGNPAPGIARLNSNGTFDNTFNPAAGAGGSSPNVRCINIQPDGKLVLTGEFITWNGLTANRIVRLNANGSADLTFNTGTGAASYILASHVLPTGKILINGAFSSYDGTTRNRICRINGNLPTDAGFTMSSSVVCGVGNGITVTDTSTNFPTAWQWSVTPSAGVTIANSVAQSTAINFASTGTYTVQLLVTNGVAYDSTTQVVNVYALPTAVATAQGPVTFCNGGSVQINANAAVSYLWSNGATTQNITATQSGNYSVMITDANGCQSAPSNSITVLEIPLINPDICMVTVDTVLADHNIILWEKSLWDTLSLDSVFIYKDTAVNAYKKMGAVSIAASGQFHDSPALSDPNFTDWRYKIALLDTCGLLSPMSPYHKTIWTQQAPPGTFSIGGGGYEVENVTGFVPNYALMRDDLSTGIWNQVGPLVPGNAAGVSDPAYASFPNAKWRIESVGVPECDPDAKYSLDPALMAKTNKSRSNLLAPPGQIGIDNVSSSSVNFTVFPNPTNGNFTLQFFSGRSENIKIEVVNLLGEIVYEEDYAGKKGENKIQVSLNTAKGIYFAKLNGNYFYGMRKIIFE